MSIEWAPLIVSVAPNGARKTKDDHPALPLTPDEIAATAVACRDAGAALLHLHVRDREGRHSLDTAAYRTATAAVRAAVGDSLIVQVTSEAVGRYSPVEQMTMVREVHPEAVSLALRELAPSGAEEGAYAAFLTWVRGEGILAQHILYSPEEVPRFQALRREGVIPEERPSVLFVLGRSGKTMPRPPDIVPYLQALSGEAMAAVHWGVCVFGANEGACAAAAMALGGHVRIGFENNLYLPDGDLAPGNAALVLGAARAAQALGRPLAGADEARSILRPR